MFRRLRETGPALLIPAAWGTTTAAHLGVVTRRPVFVMHGVMCVLLVAFAAASWREMEAGVLRTWRRVILAGTPFAIAGLAGFVVPTGSTALFAAAISGWMLLPAAGFVSTAGHVSAGARIYLSGAALCVLGAVLYAFGAVFGPAVLSIAGLGSVGVGQTAGILDTVLRY
jgi:hypothetical protein